MGHAQVFGAIEANFVFRPDWTRLNAPRDRTNRAGRNLKTVLESQIMQLWYLVAPEDSVTALPSYDVSKSRKCQNARNGHLAEACSLCALPRANHWRYQRTTCSFGKPQLSSWTIMRTNHLGQLLDGLAVARKTCTFFSEANFRVRQDRTRLNTPRARTNRAARNLKTVLES